MSFEFLEIFNFSCASIIKMEDFLETLLRSFIFQ